MSFFYPCIQMDTRREKMTYQIDRAINQSPESNSAQHSTGRRVSAGITRWRTAATLHVNFVQNYQAKIQNEKHVLITIMWPPVKSGGPNNCCAGASQRRSQQRCIMSPGEGIIRFRFRGGTDSKHCAELFDLFRLRKNECTSFHLLYDGWYGMRALARHYW